MDVFCGSTKSGGFQRFEHYFAEDKLAGGSMKAPLAF
jgi:hypothetical protein